MKKRFRILILIWIVTLIFSSFSFPSFAQEVTSPPATAPGSLELNCKSAVLMDAASGQVLYEQNPDLALPPASVTKIMTLLLIMEAIDSGKITLNDMVSTSEYAASMGGSQVYLKIGETMSVEDMLKSVVISSANDAAVALAEFVSGDIDSFVRRMNSRAAELGMSATHFENVTGLDDSAQNHLTSAKDIAIMSRALIAHPTILKYSSIWMDTIRGGAFGLTNTNRLIRFYRGATGLKTGSTSKAGFCVSVTAQRDGLSLICVIMGAESRDIRNAQATKLLDWGFANYAAFEKAGQTVPPVRVTGGIESLCPAGYEKFCAVVNKDSLGRIQQKICMEDSVSAPIQAGDRIGKVEYYLDGVLLGSVDITAQNDIPRIDFWGVWLRMIRKIILC